MGERISLKELNFKKEKLELEIEHWDKKITLLEKFDESRTDCIDWRRTDLKELDRTNEHIKELEKEVEGKLILNIELKEVIINKVSGTMILNINGENQKVDFTEEDLKNGR